jgi:hypothetical protein
MNLASALPHDELASSGFCLADPGKQYLIFLPQGGEVTVDLSAAGKVVNAEWLHVSDGSVSTATGVQGGPKRAVKSPFIDAAVLYLWTE